MPLSLSKIESMFLLAIGLFELVIVINIAAVFGSNESDLAQTYRF